MFRADDGAIVAIDARRVLATVAKYEQPIRLGVTGIDLAGIWHYNQVEFRIEQ